jgi:hypothetical protein
LADDFLDRWRGAEDLPAFSSVVRGIELAFELKKFASGMPSEVTEVNTHVTGKIDLEWEMAIKRAYARKAQAAATVIDVEEVKPEKAPLNPNLNLNPSQSGTAKEGEVSK